MAKEMHEITAENASLFDEIQQRYVIHEWYICRTPWHKKEGVTEYIRVTNNVIDRHYFTREGNVAQQEDAPEWLSLIGKSSWGIGLARMGFKKTRSTVTDNFTNQDDIVL